MYGYPGIVKVKSVRGNVHEYLPMTLYYNTRGDVKNDTRKNVESMIG